jgi:chromate reductase
MPTPLNVAVLVGSLRKASYTRRVARALIALAPPSISCGIVEIGDLPLYTEDLDATPPVAWTRFRDEIRAADAVLITTPEYNRSVPGALKNAIDVGSRPDYPSAWDGLPTGVVSVSPFKLGGFGANHHIRQSLVFLNMPVMQQPEAYIGDAAGMFDETGEAPTAGGGEFLARVINAFAAWAILTQRDALRIA